MNWIQQIASVLTAPINKTQGRYHEPDGGLALARHKPGLQQPGTALTELPLPAQLVYPLLDYSTRPVKPIVSPGTPVTLGQWIAPGIIATANGVVHAIEPRAFIHPSHSCVPSIVVDVDAAAKEQSQALAAMDALSVDRLERACISGLGGAGFSTATKFSNARKCNRDIHTLVINAVECEPLISCDEALILSDARNVVNAVVAMATLSACQRCVIAMEDDKVDALAAIEEAIQAVQTSTGITLELAPLSAIYPSGAESVLLQRLTGKAIPEHTRASDHGVLCLNIATVFAAWRAQHGYPLISRIVTIGGTQASHACNVRVRIGTSVSEVLRMTGNEATTASTRVRAGGPLSGFDLQSLCVPVRATTNCIALEKASAATRSSACIRCNKCSDACPVNLLPQQLFWYANHNEFDGARRFGLDSCIECGCCDIVCPSSITLTSTFRHARASLREQRHQQNEAELARQRYESHKARVTLRDQEARRIREEKKSQLSASSDPIADALARARARKKQR